MPQITVYLRQGDVEAWKSVEKKSEFLHNALQHLSTYDGAPIVLRETLPPTTHFQQTEDGSLQWWRHMYPNNNFRDNQGIIETQHRSNGTWMPANDVEWN